MNAIVAAGGFDYSTLPAEIASEARAVAARVRSRHGSMISGIIDTGIDLAIMKERLGHGGFLNWIAAEFQMSDRTARNYMNAAARFGDKKQTVLHLPPTAIYALAGAPEPVVQQVFAKYPDGEMVEPEVIKVMVKEAKSATKPVRLGRLTARQKQAAQRRIDKADAEIKARQEVETKAAEEAVLFLRESLGDNSFATFRDLFLKAGAYRFERLLRD